MSSLIQYILQATVKLNKMVAEKVASEKKHMAKQLNEMEIKVKLIEDKLNGTK